jgi:UV DNA damage repair endonuclease
VLDHDPSKSLISTTDHLLQLCLHTGICFGRDVHHQWIFFDDLWAGANPDLADGILRYAQRWDVLSGD